MISAFVVSQILAGLAFLFGLGAYQCRERRTTLVLFMCAQICTSTHFFLLGAVVGGFVMGLSAVRFFTSLWTTHVAVKYIFIIAALLVGAFVYEIPYDILPVLASVFGTLAAFESDNKKMRWFFIGGSATILGYNVLIGSPVASLAGLFFLSSALIGYWRFHICKKEAAT